MRDAPKARAPPSFWVGRGAESNVSRVRTPAKPPHVCLLFAGENESGPPCGPIQKRVGWLPRLGQRGPDGCGRFADRRWTTSFIGDALNITAFCARLSTVLAIARPATVAAPRTTSSTTARTSTLLFAGHETTAVTVTWCLMLLATHPAWQDRARAEALEVCRGGTELDVDVLRRLKTITMVIQETLRLYPPGSLIMREALTDFKLGGLDIPRGTIIQTAIAMLHLDKDVWGQDAGEFRPDRFGNGSHMYLPFGHGPRICAGQNLAMMGLKVVLVRLLTKFAFSPSPGYRHAPLFRLTIEPGFGMPLVVTKLP